MNQTAKFYKIDVKCREAHLCVRVVPRLRRQGGGGTGMAAHLYIVMTQL